MKAILITLIFVLFSLTGKGQVGRILVEGKSFEYGKGGIADFKFEPSEVTLTKSTVHYLDKFGELAQKRLPSNSNYILELTVESASIQEAQSVESQRFVALLYYLESKHGIDRSRFKLRITQVRTSTICEGFVSQKGNELKENR